MSEGLLLYSLAEFESIILDSLKIVQAKKLVEIGCETGDFTTRLIEWVEQVEGFLYCVEPTPTEAVIQMCKSSTYASLLPEISLSALQKIEQCDAYLVDGDHNYYTVSKELRLIFSYSNQGNKNALVFLHDVGWPCGYRDLYYSPKNIPSEALHSYSYDQGVKIGSKELVEGGFRGKGEFAWAVHEGGENNGVMCAVEDFLKGNKGFIFKEIPCIFGLGILYHSSSVYSKELTNFLDFYKKNNMLSKLERNRLDLYLKVLELQDKLSPQKNHNDKSE